MKSAIVSIVSCLAMAAQGGGAAEIVRLDPGLDALIDVDAEVEVLAAGHDWVEGPVWDEAAGRLLFSDIPRNAIYAWSEEEGVSVFMKPSGYTGVADYGREPGSNGLAFDAQGRLVLCEHGDRRLSRLTENGGKITVADRFEGKRFNSPNDLAIHSSGAIYFTDPPYGLPGRQDDPRRELDFSGVFRVSDQGEVDLLIRDLARPNGIAFSPDEKTLYVSQSHGPAPVVMAYPVNDDGTLGQSSLFFDAAPFRSTGPGLPDGLKTDFQGNVWTTGPGGVFVLTPDGKLLGRILTGRATANLAFGGPDGRTLFIAANDSILRVRVATGVK